MKTLYLIRHAKSSWADAALQDFDRPLNKRGKKDAPLMGQVLNKQQVRPDLLISSPAKRAWSTAKKIAKALAYPKDKIKTDKAIYHTTKKVLLRIIQEQKPARQSVMLFGHNPELTELASMLCGQDIGNIPTCGIVCIDFKVDNWDEASAENGILRYFDYPKMHKTSK